VKERGAQGAGRRWRFRDDNHLRSAPCALRSSKVRATIAVAVVGIALFVYARPLTLAHAAAHILLLRAGMHAHYVDVGGHRIRYFAGGDGPPLLLIHGLGSSSEDWSLVVNELTRAHRVYAIDLLGWGGSDKPRDGDYSIAAQTELVRNFLDAIRVPRADVGGVSMGGWVALRLAALHPERVQRLVLIDSAGLDFPTTLNESSFAPTTMDEARHLLWLQSDEFTKLPDFVVADFLRRARREGWILRASMRAMLTRRDVMDGKLQRVTMPTLIVWGANDRLAPPALAARFHQQLPQSRVVMVPGCGHLAAIECRATVMPVVTRFLLPARGGEGGGPSPRLRGEGGAQRRMRGAILARSSPSPGLRPPSPRKRGEGPQCAGRWPFSPLAGRRWRAAPDEGRHSPQS